MLFRFVASFISKDPQRLESKSDVTQEVSETDLEHEEPPTKPHEEEIESSTETRSASLLVSAARSLGQRLRYVQILSTIEKINKSSADLLGTNEEEQSKVQLPRVTVVGDESAGKSSTLERIAMAHVLPRSRGICTRQPIVLKLRKDCRYAKDKPHLNLTIPGRQDGTLYRPDRHGSTTIARATHEGHCRLWRQGNGD